MLFCVVLFVGLVSGFFVCGGYFVFCLFVWVLGCFLVVLFVCFWLVSLFVLILSKSSKPFLKGGKQWYDRLYSLPNIWFDFLTTTDD